MQEPGGQFAAMAGGAAVVLLAGGVTIAVWGPDVRAITATLGLLALICGAVFIACPGWLFVRDPGPPSDSRI